MIKLQKRPIQIGKEEVIVGRNIVPKKLDALPLHENANPNDYALLFRNDQANSAISMQQYFGDLQFHPMIRQALEQGLALASARDFTPFHRDVNLALRNEGILYDANGNLLNNTPKLEAIGKSVNGCWIYLNDAFESSQGEEGFLGLDIVRVTGFNGEDPILEREPLEECVYDCWADIEFVNDQGFYTQAAKTDKFEKGRTVYVNKPLPGYVAGFGAYSISADLSGGCCPRKQDPERGGFLRAEGTSSKVGEKEE